MHWLIGGLVVVGVAILLLSSVLNKGPTAWLALSLFTIKKIARMLRSHRSLILNYFRAKEQIALGAVEGLNNKAKVTTKKAYGFKSFEVIKLALYHTLGDLPEPVVTHGFCG